MRTRRLTFALMWSLLAPAVNADLKPFLVDSLERIEADHKGQPFLIVLWSLDCPPCIEELRTLQSLHKRIPPNRLILISTDAEASPDELNQVLTRFDLAGRENWVFADTYTERLRHRIDANWFGELPRSYFYDEEHRRTAKSGVLSRETINQWVIPDA